MSRGFVREGDQEEVPVVPQRSYLPPGVPNFVTREGMNQLLKEKEELIAERENIGISNENEKRISRNLINAKLQLLNDRISDARVIDTPEQHTDEAAFGATVTIREMRSGKVQTFRIVGVDEADIAKGKISFISPLARMLLNKRAGESVTLKRDRDNVVYEIMEITYR